ncbi:MAG: TerC family protein [Alphaproteobacteria bacterium]|nr:TerC family protein [Alphaproteobacteria bacterium]
MFDLVAPGALAALGEVILIDLALAGDNAVVVGMAAAGLPAEQRRRAILIGIVAATLMRVVFAGFTTQLLQVIGLVLAGGILLMWVAWKMWREIREHRTHDKERGEAVLEGKPVDGAPPKTFRQAVTQIMVADISMSLDNVLAVAGAAREHAWVLLVGLALSITLMGAASTLIARLLQRHHWIAYIGLAIVLWVAVQMIWEGANEVAGAVQ